MPFWRKKPTLEDQVIELKISARTLNSQYKKCEAESKKYERMVKQEIAKGNQETAMMYANSSIRMKSQGKQFMLLGSQLEAAAMNLQSVHNMSTVSDAMANSVAAIKSASTSLDISRMYKVMEQFKQACEDSQVQTAQFPNAIGQPSVEDSEEAKNLYDQLAMEEGNRVGGKAEQTPLGVPTDPNATALPASNDLMSRLNNL